MVALIIASLPTTHVAAPLVEMINALLMRRDLLVHVSRIFRERSKAADTLAHLGHSLDWGVSYFAPLAECVKHILWQNSVGIASRRGA